MFLFQPESRRFAVSWKPLFPLGHCFIYFLEELQGNIWLVITRYENFNSVDVTWDCRWHLLLLNICNQYLFLYVCFMLVICCACVLYLLLFSTTQIYIVRKRNFKCFFSKGFFILWRTFFTIHLWEWGHSPSVCLVTWAVLFYVLVVAVVVSEC